MSLEAKNLYFFHAFENEVKIIWKQKQIAIVPILKLLKNGQNDCQEFVNIID